MPFVLKLKDTYRTLKEFSTGYFRDRGSKFYAFAYPVKSEEETKDILASLKKEYHDARHFCYAWQIGRDEMRYRINDDGEPSGSAGKPIYGQIQSHNITNVFIVVIRYFGGTKLGIPGLINAYKTAAREAIENNSIIKCIVTADTTITFDYQDTNEVMRILKEEGAEIVNTRYEMDCEISFEVRMSNQNNILGRLKKVKSLKLKNEVQQ